MILSLSKCLCLMVLVTFPSGAFTQDVAGTTEINGQLFKWTHTTDLPSKMVISWISTDPHYVTFEMKGPSKGYISIGFSPTGSMAGADIFLGWIDSNGEPHLLDMYGTHNGQPNIDEEQNLELIGGRQDESGTTIVFRRRWDTCDDEDFIIGSDTMRMIWATSPSNPGVTPSMKYFPRYHGADMLQRGVKSIFMKVRSHNRKFPDQEDVYPPNVYQVDLTVKDVVVPRRETYYHCKILKFPKLASKHHIIAHRPVIAPASLPHVHHIAIFKCHVPEALGKSTGDVFERYLNFHGTDCFATPKEWTEYCFEFRIAIGVGDEGDILPDHLGDVMGDTDGPAYYRIEVHYENPQRKELTDSSGIRVFYSSNLREYETAILFGGHRRTPFLTIPPYQKEYSIHGFCGSDCTQQGLPETGIKIYSVLLHAHLTARKITLKHIRDGVELPPIAQDNYYDFNYQRYRVFNQEEEVIVLPGDQLITECVYETEKNDTFVYGGLSTRREMCESFIVYYPKSALTDCRSQPEFYSYLNAISVENAEGGLLRSLALPLNTSSLPEEARNIALPDDSYILDDAINNVTHDLFREVVITKPKNLEGLEVHDYMTGLNWHDEAFSRTVELKRKSGFHYMHCSSPGGRKIRTKRDAYLFPVYKPRKMEKRHCHLRNSSGGLFPKLSFTLLTVLIIMLFK